jgi:hypothetical protein
MVIRGRRAARVSFCYGVAVMDQGRIMPIDVRQSNNIPRPNRACALPVMHMLRIHTFSVLRLLRARRDHP